MGHNYRGRFAPSPTGPLHLGSLVTALGSWLDARRQNGTWVVRMEDVDQPRCNPAWGESILHSLAAHGMESDEDVIWQSTRTAAYRQALSELKAYPCGCSRAGLENGRYPGTCRDGLSPGMSARTWRFRVRPGVVAFDDRLEGYSAQDVERSVGDFVLLRADGCFAYQLAVVVDDIAKGITDVVRGGDLLDSTPRQLLLYEALGVQPPRYMHLPLVLNARGEKLSKQTLAPPVDDSRAEENIREAARCLGLHPPAGSLRQTLDWCILRR